MRLGDLDELKNEFEWLESVVCECQKDSVRDSIQRVENATTIDPETLPIVQELRKELERVTRERDAAVSEIESIIAYGLHLPNTCPFCKNEQCKMRGGTEPCIPKWRGIQEVQEDKQL